MRYLISFLIISFLLIIICPFVLAQAPETLEEAKTIGERILWGFPEALKKPWQEALDIWNKMINWVRPWLQFIWDKIYSFLGKEIEEKKPEVKEEFEKEKQKMKEDIPKTTESLWERFKELIK